MTASSRERQSTSMEGPKADGGSYIQLRSRVHQQGTVSGRMRRAEFAARKSRATMDGDDGPWSSFTIQIGTPIQNVRVFVSPAGSGAWVVSDAGCVEDQGSCQEDRGRTFDPHRSTSYSHHGTSALGVNKNLEPSLQAEFGNDTLGLGLQGSGGPVLIDQPILSYTDASLQLGMFGVNAISINDTDGGQGFPSYLSSLKRQGKIPSLSFGYTAGNQYRLKKVYGSLTLGGYDQSLFVPNSWSSSFVGADPTRYLQVSIQKIIGKELGGQTDNLLPAPIMANVDPTESMMWLPTDACKAFEAAFGLKYDPATNLYLVDDDLHQSLQEKISSITFTLSNQTSGGDTIDIALPYMAFDLQIKPPFPGINQTSQYFPLRRAANDSQYTLGRTLLQESYLKVDWERRNFTLSQCNFTQGAEAKLMAISSPGASTTGISTGIKVGVAVAVVAGTLVIITLTTWLYLRWRNARRRAAEEAAKTGVNPKEGMIRQGFAKGEMGTGIENARFEMEGSDGNALKPYGGRTPPWVDEKGQYPGFAANGISEMDTEAQRAELVGAIGFYGGRGVHEMYDPSSVPPIELPTGTEEQFSPRVGAKDRSGRSSSSKPSPSKSSIFGPFSRKKRRAELDSSSSSGPSPQSSPTHHLSHTASGPASPLSPDYSSSRHLVDSDNERPDNHRRGSNETSSGPSGPSSPSSPERAFHKSGSKYASRYLPSHRHGSLDEGPREQRSPERPLPSLPSSSTKPTGPPRSSVPTSPTADVSPPSQNTDSTNGSEDAHDSAGRRRPRVSPPSSGNGNNSSSNERASDTTFSPISRRGTFSPPRRQDTGMSILSPVSPEAEEPPRKGGGGYGGFRWGR
ncbi:uncharacterized protein KY384_006036 [Bacidia gigantensis]|uniref:uncharacterized protein n=1 Tax=Bacidia gigantensis TaxID=2732470 RepID=UPI001D049A6E|nr:uncharacterized protein KY384_006036 [Bacidia gigantensis]KAG8529399.1 hypothetical protein KY384_006036 [Bacidia gigantensis]